MSRRTDSKKETRQLILTAARQLFAQKGMEDCTIRDIARKAGVSPASVVVHFQSKTGLLEEALNLDLENTLSELTASMPPDQGLLERLLHLATGFFRLYDTNRNLYRALIRHTVFEPVKETPHITSLTDRYIHFLAGMIAEEQTRGHIKPEVDAMVATGAIFSLYLGVLTLLFRQPELPVAMATEVLKAMTGQYLEGITRRSTP